MSENHELSDEEKIDSQAHKRLLNAVGRLNKNQFIKKATRNEPILKRSEFHLVKPHTDKLNAKESVISIPDLAKVLIKNNKHLTIGKELRNNQRNKKVLEKPLIKPVADKIQRSIGYERAKQKLNRWEAIITKNRATDHMTFPLKRDGTLDIVDNKDTKQSPYRIKSRLMMQIEALQPTSNSKTVIPDKNEAHTKISRSEMIAHSKEIRLLRIRESQRNAKARLQNKIKSKKFHKIMKKEKMKEQLKEFEILQKLDPEAALKKLDQFEKNRIAERALLRHKNTGTWAKNLQVRAKYDKDVRKELAQQLSLSRELTQKKQSVDDISDNEYNDELPLSESANHDPFNPWVKSKNKIDENNSTSTSGYRKYWINLNQNKTALKDYNQIDSSNFVLAEKAIQKKAKQKVNGTLIVDGWTIVDCNSTTKEKLNIPDHFEDIDDLFDEAEQSLEQQVAMKIKLFQNNLDNIESKARGHSSRQNKRDASYKDLSFKHKVIHPDIDEELQDTTYNEKHDVSINDLEEMKRISSAVANDNSTNLGNINPDKFITIKPQYLRTEIPDMEGGFDEDDENIRATNKHLTIAQAFEDDDIVLNFEQDKDSERKKNEPQDIDLTLPGWGSWGGCGLKVKNKTRKLILKFPKDEKRRDENKGNVIIVDNGDTKFKKHQVSSLPFPFTSIKDYEASIRAPIGRDFLPVSAHRLLTKPAVTSMLGAIIEPMDEEILIKKPVKPKNRTARRIADIELKETENTTKRK